MLEIDSKSPQPLLKDTESSKTIEEHPDTPWQIFPELTITYQISKGKYPIYQAELLCLNISFALKIFPYRDGKISPYYLNEIKFYNLVHPNVIRYIKHTDLWLNNACSGKNSYILMEMACYGDFQQLIAKYHIPFSEMLLRTYFHQLISGLEYLHSEGIAHLDLKPENLLLDEFFNLKIADFDLAFKLGDTHIRSRGSKCYRAPELENRTCKDPMAADIYSLGIIIFVLLSRGMFPFPADFKLKGRGLQELLEDDAQIFWEAHKFFKKRRCLFFDEDFRDLFTLLTKTDPSKRPTLRLIKESRWYNGRIYSKQELEKKMERLFAVGSHIFQQ